MKIFGDIEVELFGVFYDVVELMFYVFYNNNRKLVFIIDMGYVSDCMKGVIKGVNVFVFESNYDVEMFCMGCYLWSIK